jgi:transposase
MIFEDILNDNENEYELKYGIDFKSNFKIVDTKQGFYVDFIYLYKRGLNKDETKFLENEFLKKPINVNNISGLELNNFNTNKQYTAVFTLYYYDNDKFDMFLHHTIK